MSEPEYDPKPEVPYRGEEPHELERGTVMSSATGPSTAPPPESYHDALIIDPDKAWTYEEGASVQMVQEERNVDQEEDADE